MKKFTAFILASVFSMLVLSACNSEVLKPPAVTTTTPATEATIPTEATTTTAEETMPVETEATTTTAATQSPASDLPEGEVVDGATATKENPVPVGTWAAVPVRASGKENLAYVRITRRVTDDSEIQATFKKFLEGIGRDEMPSLGDNEQYLEYVVIEYQVFFPSNFSESDRISFWGLSLKRSNNQQYWTASNGARFIMLGSMIDVDVPSSKTGYPKNGETVTCKVAYPMIKDYTDYTIQYSPNALDGSGEMEIHFAIQ
jgi:hypothetical protein